MYYIFNQNFNVSFFSFYETFCSSCLAIAEIFEGEYIELQCYQIFEESNEKGLKSESDETINIFVVPELDNIFFFVFKKESGGADEIDPFFGTLWVEF